MWKMSKRRDRPGRASADWEPAYICAEPNRPHTGDTVKTISLDKKAKASGAMYFLTIRSGREGVSEKIMEPLGGNRRRGFWGREDSFYIKKSWG